MPNKIQRNYLIEQELLKINGDKGALKRNLITTAAKTVILANQFKLTSNSTENALTLDAIEEGGINIKENLFGLPIWDIIEFRYGEKSAVLKIATVEITNSKNIITTPIQGLDGTVKEYISDGDDEIRIRATIVGGAADYYPQTEIEEILSILKIKDAINIYSTVLNKYFNINSVIVTDYSFSQPEVGMRNIQSLDLSLLSDDPSIYKVILQY